LQLSSEDALRLNVLMANKPLAIRINESRLTLFALFENSETEIQLHANCKDDLYLKRVRGLLSERILGSPGGYPIFLQRWTRVGKARKESIQQLLLLGETEAVVAAAFSKELTDELARRIWWAMDDPENARQLLKNKAVIEGQTGPILAHYLIEFLPFETEPEVILENIRLILQPNLIDESTRQKLWQKSQRKLAYMVGFLIAMPHDLPIAIEAHPFHADIEQSKQDKIAQLLCQVYSSKGQAFIYSIQMVLKKPANQDIVMAIFKVLAHYFSTMREFDPEDKTLAEIETHIQNIEQPSPVISQLIEQKIEIKAAIEAMAVLSRLNYGVLRPVLLTSTAMGTLMRKKIAPVMEPINQYIKVLTPPKE